MPVHQELQPQAAKVRTIHSPCSSEARDGGSSGSLWESARLGCRFKKAHVTHPELKMTFCLDIVSVKKNPQAVAVWWLQEALEDILCELCQSALYTSLGVITKGTIIEARRIC